MDWPLHLSPLDKRKYVYPSKFISSRRSSTIRNRSFASSISLYVWTKLVRWKRISSMIPMESVSWRILISDPSSITSSRKSSLWISYRENISIQLYSSLWVSHSEIKTDLNTTQWLLCCCVQITWSIFIFSWSIGLELFTLQEKNCQWIHV